MPELPEVETVRRTLEMLILDKEIKKVTVLWPKIIKHPDVDQFCDALIGERFVQLGRRGKFLILYTEKYALISHLRMEGRYAHYEAEEPVALHTHVIFTFTDGTELRYKDVRKFGTMHLFEKGKEFDQPPLSTLGPEPFDPEFTAGYLQKRLSTTQRSIKTALLDQTVLVGLGNIYVDEALFRSNIHPERIASSLKRKEWMVLHEQIKATLGEAVEKGGSTIRSYVNSQGQMGMFQLELFVYGRKGENCKVCGTPLQKIVVGGRGTVFCPKCQKKK